MNQKNETKQAIVDAALYLFHLKGFHATSIRDIAGKAQVNTANIAYYFKNKHGLLEYCFICYLEEYIQLVESHVISLKDVGPIPCLLEMVSDILDFQRQHFLAASFIHGEFSLDSSLNRELLSTYLTKEKYYFQLLLEEGIKKGAFVRVPIPVFILQLKGLLTAPVLHSLYSMEVLHFFPQEMYYTQRYKDQVDKFLRSMLFVQASKANEGNSKALVGL
ncbi:forespore capture DNA-binding protein RefZ [Peribacillus sp. SCS-155]|uniref:forespore capture DNA-binding protein RefZ n=1 Tax=Peribacillus sedimenti TaxID=3115297 RepID=UPI00390616CF